LLYLNWGIRKIHGVNSQFAVLRTREIDPDPIALHHATNVCGNLAQYVAEVEAGYHTVCQIEQELQALLWPQGIAEVDRIVHRQCDLVCYERAETDFILGVSIPVDAGDHEAAEAAMRSRQRKGADGMYAGFPHHWNGSREPGLTINGAQNNGFLIPVHPCSQSLLTVDFRWTMLPVATCDAEVPVDFMR